MFILKIKGGAKIPDYIQVRDDNFTLKAYFRVDRSDEGLKKCHDIKNPKEVLELINLIPFGKLTKI